MSREAFGDPPEQQDVPECCPNCGSDFEPLFGKAEIETAVAAERERAHNSGFVEASRIHGAEIERLRAREKACETMDHAQKVALVRALQECCEALGLHDMASPAELVAAVRALRA